MFAIEWYFTKIDTYVIRVEAREGEQMVRVWCAYLRYHLTDHRHFLWQSLYF